ncbi:pentapeptide repeat-containing protein [Amycolatopsis sp. NPDC051045]|uniref:pentapeptide repeat-containing protein n=1 Tax=Amycolatopsis sp. NPDC051045 TaxID=3156922 RepID=UPI0034238195
MADDQSEVTSPAAPGKVLTNRMIAWCAAALVLVAAGLGWPLLAVYGLGLEAIRTVGTIVLGAGGAVGLLLAARRQQTAEQDLVEKRRDLAHKEHVQRHTEAVAADNLAHQQRIAATTEADAAERRITELYAKSVEQLGSDKAPVRLGGLYALERLAQNTRSQRPTVVNVLCAYLRMPFEPATEGDPPKPSPDQVQEQHVRITAQRILAQHLAPGTDSRSDADTFWPDIDLDLVGATLIDFRFARCRVRSARFTGATFDGDADLGATVFLDRAEFDRATFTGSARFSDAIFAEGARFRTAQFLSAARFRGTTFGGDARFTRTRFHDHVWFGNAVFRADAGFTDTHFEQEVRFDDAVFAGTTTFHAAAFARPAHRLRKTFRGVRVRAASLSHWPLGWTASATTDEPWPDSGGSWHKLEPADTAQAPVT